MSIKSTPKDTKPRKPNPVEEKVKNTVSKIDVNAHLERYSGMWSTFANLFVGHYDEPSGKILFRRMIATMIDIVVIIFITRYFNFENIFYITLTYYVMLEGLIGIGSVGKWLTGLKIEIEDLYSDGIVKYSLSRLILRAVLKTVMLWYVISQVYEVHFDMWDDQLIWFPFTAFMLSIGLFMPARMSTVGRSIHDALAGTFVNSRLATSYMEMDSPNRMYDMFERNASKAENIEKIKIDMPNIEGFGKGKKNTDKASPPKPVSNKQSSKERDKDLDKLF